MTAAVEILWPRRVSGAQAIRAAGMVDDAPPGVRRFLLERYARTAGSERSYYSDGRRVRDSFNDAHAQLAATHCRLRAARVPVAFDDDEIELRAQAAAKHCLHARTVGAALAYLETQGIDPPKGRNVTARGTLARLRSPVWWRRRYRAKLCRAAESVFRELGLVHAHASPYVTADGLARFSAQKAKSARFLRASDALCVQTGELFPLDEIAAKTVSNPAIRRGEMMVRARGFEECARQAGHEALFVTLTCPSAFHAFKRSGEPNELWNGASPRDGQAWLNRMWARARAKLKRLSINFYGFRIAEPHHDATPHWHVLLFVVRHHAGTVRDVLRAIWLSEYGSEPGAREHRLQCQAIDPAAGSATGYIAKYVSKNIDGAGRISSAESDEGAGTVGAHVPAVEAWARIHGIRQFQQLGGPSVVLWRELRRIREPVEAEPIEAARAATDKTEAGGPSWSRFIAALGGIHECRERSRAMVDKAPPMTNDAAARRVLKLNAWGELPAERPAGVKCVWRDRIRRVATRVLEWVRVFRSSLFSALGPVAITVRGAPIAGAPSGAANPQAFSQAGPA